jgi:hypothetical protein
MLLTRPIAIQEAAFTLEIEPICVQAAKKVKTGKL